MERMPSPIGKALCYRWRVEFVSYSSCLIVRACGRWSVRARAILEIPFHSVSFRLGQTETQLSHSRNIPKSNLNSLML